MDEQTIRWVLFSGISGFGVISQNRLLRLCGGIDGCFEKSRDELLRLVLYARNGQSVEARRLESFLNARDDRTAYHDAQRIVADCEKIGITIVTCADERYPRRFAGLPDAPVVIYIKGLLKINEYKRSVGLIGARRCSGEGKTTAITIAENEIEQGSAIISGMAKGIDSYAHTAAIKNGGYTLAVLGNGPDICYPKEHGSLYSEIIAVGCVLSEYPPGTEPRKYLFPKRNRLIAALSDELFVIDTGRHSGTETTVESCISYGRTVRCLTP